MEGKREREKKGSKGRKGGREERKRVTERKGGERKISRGVLIGSKGMSFPRKKAYSYSEVQREGRKSRCGRSFLF